MADHGFRSARKHRGSLGSMLRLDGPDRIDAAMHRPQPARPQPVVDHIAADPDSDQLTARDHPMWSRERHDRALNDEERR